MKKITLVAAVMALSACHHAKEKDKDKPDNTVQQLSFPQSSANLSKWIRTHVSEYWSYMANNPIVTALPQNQGVIAGDPHIANFAPISIRTENGNRQMAFLNIDMDDAGYGPFAVDFLRFVIITKATQRKVKVSTLVEAYINGLKGKTIALPKEAASLLAVTLKDYESAAANEVQERSNEQKFIIKGSKQVGPYQGSLTIDRVQQLFTSETVLDLASRVETTNSAERAEVVLVLTADAEAKTRRIYELKQWRESALGVFARQKKDPLVWLAEVKSVFWAGIKTPDYNLVQLDQQWYWLREKKVNKIDVPYSGKSSRAIEYVNELAQYDAYLLGKWHGQQSASYVQQLTSLEQVKQFHETLKLAAKDYLLHANNTAGF